MFCYIYQHTKPQAILDCLHRVIASDLLRLVLTQNAVLQRKLLVRKQALERDEMKHSIHRVVRSNNADVSEKQYKFFNYLVVI